MSIQELRNFARIKQLSIHFIKKKVKKESPTFMKNNVADVAIKRGGKFDHSKYIKTKNDIPADIGINGFM